MDDRDRDDNPTSGHSQPIDPPVSEEEQYRLASGQPRSGHGGDVGRTSGGSSLGHAQPERVGREGSASNNVDQRGDNEPTMPSKDSTVDTKI